MKIAVVTPYFKENRDILTRCIESVRKQSVPVDHILVADGFPQYWVEEYGNINHLVLRKNNSDFGDTPRTLGFVLGVRHDYDIIQFLDADNVLFPDHMSSVLECFATHRPDLIISRRAMLRADGSILDVRLEEDETLAHVDTSCFVFYRTAFHVGLKWSYIPKPMGFHDDRVFWAAARNSSLKIVALSNKTVGYSCMWPRVYKLAGEHPPEGARDMSVHQMALKIWWNGLNRQEQERIQGNLGITIKID